ncbi:ABC transporter permease [Lachnospira sp.]|jgi:putative ABC transport system permease protein|uniref:ABC transporter permease n=1 Tax=Lachnospira sp. TaxID=2049031 RepID=UPI0025797EEA|nr:ABC transporter permease [Lachnospira sp.]
MGLALIKDLLREIKQSFGRFFAIFAICFIGVAFFAGVTASSSDMKSSSDAYYDDYNLYDLRILSSIGFDNEDVNQISQVEGVENVFASHYLDLLTTVDEVEKAVRVTSLPDSDGVNSLKLVKGRLPEADNECVIRYESTTDLPEIGDEITFSKGEESEVNALLEGGENLEDEIANTSYTVVGYVYTPVYVSYYIDSTTVGNGTLSYLVFVNDENFKSQYYSEVYLNISGAKDFSTYDNDYFEYLESYEDAILAVGDSRFEERYNSLVSEIEEKREARLATLNDEIYAQVVANLTSIYQSYYPDRDVSDMIAPYIEPNYQKALAEFDYSLVNEPFDQALTEVEDRISNYTWLSLTRNESYSFVDYKQSANRMGAIATVFPIFFIVVAGLVCLTTMARLIDEQRGLIGTYKALGYSRFIISLKYVLYALIASMIGGILGCIVGLKIFPYIIINAWNIIYQIPDIVPANHTILSIIAVLSLTLTTMIVTIIACGETTAEVPSELMRPKAPISGKKILLEKVGFIWKRLNFTTKVTMRNLFLYKKRFIMTIIGIAGCGALILAGFGIKDSIRSLVTKQFSEIFHYDLVVSLNSNLEEESLNSLTSDMDSNLLYTDYLLDYGYTETASNNDKEIDAGISIVSDIDAYKNYLSFRDRKSHKKVNLTDEGAILSEKLARDLGVKVGDSFTINDANGAPITIKVSGICEMYVGHSIYMTANYYTSITGEDLGVNRMLVKLPDSEDETINLVSSDLMDREQIKALTFLNTNVEHFENMIKSLDIVTYVLIISAGLLAFVVVYNLINVNISERIREIATTKVLGFYNFEVGMYVYREIILLTLIGGVFGLILGRLLHVYIMTTVELEDVMFGSYISAKSFVLTYLITFIFSLIVDLVMYPRLSKIKMVESLKSVE